jgi:hypothetical protein
MGSISSLFHDPLSLNNSPHAADVLGVHAVNLASG